MTALTTLTAWGIVGPAEVIATAAATGVPLALACALLEQESGGGANVWGHDGVPTGGAYVKGTPVTEVAYKAYRHALALGLAGQQGVGPCQLTARDYQDRADRIGGCWNWQSNLRIGLELIGNYVVRWGPSLAFRAYNGGAGTVTDPARYPSPPARVYEHSAMAKYVAWQTRLGATSTTGTTTTGDDDMQPDERAALMEVRDALRASGLGKGRLPGRSTGTAKTADDAFGWILSAAGWADESADAVAALRQQVADLSTRIPNLPSDWPAQLAAALVAHMSGGPR